MAANPAATSLALLDDPSLPQLLGALDAQLDSGFLLSLLDDDAAITATVTPSPSPSLSADDGLTLGSPSDLSTELHTPVAELPEQPTDGRLSTTSSDGQAAKLSSRARLQLEKECLRAQVRELETHLKLLKQQHCANDASNNTGPEDSTLTLNGGQSSVVWEQVALRQAEEKRAAQEENMKLRMLVEDQLRVAHSLEKIMLKRSMESPSSLFDSNKRARVVETPAEVGSLLVGSPQPSSSALEQQFAETNAVMAASGLAEKRVNGDDAVARLDENDALYLECTLTRVLPFSPQEIAATAWKSLAGRRVEWSSGFYSTTKGSQDEFGVEYQASSQVRRMSATFHGRGVGARRAGPGKSFHFVWQIETTATGSAFRDQRVGLHERSYLVLMPLDGLDATSGTVLKSCVRTWPQWEHQQRPPTNVLIDLVLSSCNRNVKTVLQTIENALLEGASSQETKLHAEECPA